MRFFDKLSILMARKGITQAELAADLGITQASVSGWKSGSKPRRPLLKKLSDYFEVDPAILQNDELGLDAHISGSGRKQKDVIKAMKAEMAEHSAVWKHTDGRLCGLLVAAKSELSDVNYETLLSLARLSEGLGERIQLLEDRMGYVLDALEQKGILDD